MKKYFLLIFLLVSVNINNNVFCQDVIKTKTGDEIKAKMLSLTRKQVIYKPYGDPEFNTYTIPYKELSSIQKQNDKKATLFNHHLPRAFICLSFGPSFALGNLKSTSYANKNGIPGFAKNPQVNGKLDIAIYLYKRLGLSIGGGMYFYYLDNNAYANAYGTFFTNNNNNANWQFVHLMAGPIYSVKLAKRITWDFKARVGIIDTKTPYTNLQYFNYMTPGDPNNGYVYQYYSKWTPQLSYSLGTSFRIALSRRLAFYLAVDYMNTQPQVTGSTRIYYPSTPNNNFNGGYTDGSYSAKYKFSSLNTSAGFAYQFKRKRNKYE